MWIPLGVTKPSKLDIIPPVCKNLWWLDGVCVYIQPLSKTEETADFRKSKTWYSENEDKIQIHILGDTKFGP